MMNISILCETTGKCHLFRFEPDQLGEPIYQNGKVICGKGQQAYYAEKSAFSNSIPDLGLGMKTETPNYKYSLRVTKQAAFNYGVSKQKIEKSYVGGVFVVPAKEVDTNAAKDEITTTSILCEADDRGTIKPAEPTYQNGKVICGKGTTEVTK